MTAKEHFIHNLHQARTAHIRWVNGIKLLVSGIDVDPKHIHLGTVESDFGRWYYHEAILLSTSMSRLVIEEIETNFVACHDIYTKIYSIFFKKKKNLIGELFGINSRVSNYEMELAYRYYEEIIHVSDQLKNKLRIFEAQVLSMNDEKFITYESLMNEKISQDNPAIDKKEDITSDDNKTYFYGTRGRG